MPLSVKSTYFLFGWSWKLHSGPEAIEWSKVSWLIELQPLRAISSVWSDHSQPGQIGKSFPNCQMYLSNVHMLTIILSNLQFEANTFILMIVWLTLPVTLVKVQPSGSLTITRPTSTPDILAVKISDYLRSEWPKAAARTETDIQPARSNTPEQGRTQTASLKALPKMDTPERSLPLRVHKVWCA